MGGITISAENKRADPIKLKNAPVNTKDPPLKSLETEKREKREQLWVGVAGRNEASNLKAASVLLQETNTRPLSRRKRKTAKDWIQATHLLKV